MIARTAEIMGPAGALETLIESPRARPRESPFSVILILCSRERCRTRWSRHWRERSLGLVQSPCDSISVASEHPRARTRRVSASAMTRSRSRVGAARNGPICACISVAFPLARAVALAVAADLEPRGLVTVAPALSRIDADFRRPECPWLLVQGDSDDIVDSRAVLAWARALPAPPTLAVLAGVGHFFHSRLGRAPGARRRVLCAALRRQRKHVAMLRSLSELLSKALSEPAGQSARGPGSRAAGCDGVAADRGRAGGL